MRYEIHNIISRLLSLCDGSRVLLTLLAANTILSLSVMTAWVVCALTHTSSLWLEEWLTLPADLPQLILRPWTVVTYMFTQFHPLHFLFNLLWLFWFGKILLMVMPQSQLLLLYIGGGLAGAASFLAIETINHTHGTLTGASAAVMAVMTAAAVRMPDRHVQFLLVGAVRLKWVAGAAVVLTFLGIGGGGGAGALAAHLAGVIFGFGMARLAPAHKSGHAGRDNVRFVRTDTSPSAAPRVRRDATKVAEVLSDHRRDRHRLDQLLDKITASGYDSLSGREQEELRELSNKL